MSDALKALITEKLSACGLPKLDGSTFKEQHYSFSHGVRVILTKGTMELDINGSNQRKDVVLKKISSSFANRESQERREKLLQYFEREAGIWRHTCSHPHILELYGYTTAPDEIFPSLVSPFYPKGDLRAFVECKANRDLPVKQRIKLTGDIARGLEFLHNLSPAIVHRDIRASNALVHGEGQDLSAVIINFGSAKLSDPNLFRILSTTTSNAKQWAPPEYVVHGQHHENPTPYGDIWSLTCTCIEVFAAKDPFPKWYNMEEVLGMGGSPEPSKDDADINDATWRFLKRCWNIVPGDRPYASEAVLEFERLAINV